MPDHEFKIRLLAKWVLSDYKIENRAQEVQGLTDALQATIRLYLSLMEPLKPR